MPFPLVGLFTLTALLLASCTAEQVYTSVQEDHRRQCLLLPVWQQAHCLSLNDTTWQEYSRERAQAATGLPEAAQR